MFSAFVFAYYLLFAWSGLRVGSLALFDIASLIMFPLLIVIRGSQGVNVREMRLSSVITPCAVFLLAVVLSTFSASDQSQHIARGLGIALGLTIAAVNAMLIMSWPKISSQTVLKSLLASSLIHSTIVIAQGQFALFRDVPSVEIWQPWTRAIGLAEHPIEAGAISAYGIFIQLYLIFGRQEKSFPTVLGLLNLAVMAGSLLYSGSLTVLFGTTVSFLAFIVLTRRVKVIVASVCVVAIGVLGLGFSSFSESQLGSRVSVFAEQGGSYGTVDTRTEQVAMAMDKIGIKALINGNGYNKNELPTGLEIHNTAVAAVFHYGILALIAQLLFFLNPIKTAIARRESEYVALVAALLVIFFCCYLTGPSLARRSIWVPILTIGLMPRSTRRENSVMERVESPGVGLFEG